MTDYIGLNSIVNTESILDNLGYWNVTVMVIQERTKDLLDWEESKTKIKVIDKDLNRALGEATLTIYKILENCNMDLFSREDT